MNELIKVNQEGEMPTVSARALHEWLEAGAEYRHWFPRMCEYGFEEGRDFNPVIFERVQFEGDREVSRTITDHELTIPMAKELCMIQRSEKGKQARQYFIKVEEAWNTPEMIMARALKMAARQLDDQKVEIVELKSQVQELHPKALFADAVAASEDTILVRQMAKILKQNGIEIGQNRFFEWLRENGYLIKQKGTDYNSPTQKSMELGLFEIKETAIHHSDGSISINVTPKITGKGQRYFVDKLLEDMEAI